MFSEIGLELQSTNSICFVWRKLLSSRSNNVAYVIDWIGAEVTPLELKHDYGVVEEQKDFSNVVDVWFGCLAENHDIV